MKFSCVYDTQYGSFLKLDLRKNWFLLCTTSMNIYGHLCQAYEYLQSKFIIKFKHDEWYLKISTNVDSYVNISSGVLSSTQALFKASSIERLYVNNESLGVVLQFNLTGPNCHRLLMMLAGLLNGCKKCII